MSLQIFHFIIGTWISVLLLGVSFCQAGAVRKQPPPHPLDPLSKDELLATVTVLKNSGKVADSTRFVLIHVDEPPNHPVLPYRPGQALPRQAFADLYDWASTTPSEVIVDLDAPKLL